MEQVVRVKTPGKCSSTPNMGKQIGRRVDRSMETLETLPGKLEKEQEGFLTILLPKKDIPLFLFVNLSSYYKQTSYWQDGNHCEGLELLHDFDNIIRLKVLNHFCLLNYNN